MRTYRLVSLDIDGLRNIERARLDTDVSAVWLFGANGAGKSSVLEALYLLARGRTYRGRKFGPLVNRDQSRTRIKGSFASEPDAPFEVRFVQDSKGAQREIRPPGVLDHDPDVPLIPTKLVTDNPQSLIEGDPQLRRLFLDWNTSLWNDRFKGQRYTFQRLLLQRNAALKAKWKDTAQWDSLFVEAAQSIDESRRAFLEGLRMPFLCLKADFPFLDDLDLEYDPGWPHGLALTEAMDACRDQERSRGFTLRGPHRADFYLSRDGERASLSRGQMKVVVSLLQLACEQLHRSAGAPRSIWLLDDLQAELDRNHVRKLWSLFVETGSQIFVTGVSRPSDPLDAGPSAAMFHVEHGVLNREV
ncbi:DNA replication/repair protein RecF [Imhoffiella purpurea]|uniref:DNA replication and repair protein RecF n=1 Tax=Imhoffiella purpurea TaxID=1249627 RepID=W9VM06_9GAMM|nr:DNA replication and repair protein RecF [Imhoffiella purpurea]EXJ17137.1 DNA recombination and repair protein RecF [Imhoffiella purpurea]